MTSARRAIPLVLFATALSALPLVATLPSHPRMLAVLNNAAHAPVFGTLALVLLSLLRTTTSLSPGRRYAAALALTLVIGGAVELIQPMIGRAREWSDFLHDGLGAITGLSLASLFEFRGAPAGRRVLLALTCVAAAAGFLWAPAEAVAAYAWRSVRFPTLFQAGSRLDCYFLRHRGSRIRFEALPARWRRPGDQDALRVELVRGDWPGISLLEPQPDWTGYRSLRLDLTNPEDEPLALRIRVHDQSHNNDVSDRFSREYRIAPGSRRQIAIPLDDIARGARSRTLDLSRIGGLMLFAPGESPVRGRFFYVSRIWLD